MNKFEKTLQSLEDFELAYLMKHRLKEFMKETQNRISFELLKRGYDEQDLDEILERKKKEPINVSSKFLVCKKCGSTKFFTTEQSKENDYFSEFEKKEILKKTTYTCWICSKPAQVVARKSPSFWDRLRGVRKDYDERIG